MTSPRIADEPGSLGGTYLPVASPSTQRRGWVLGVRSVQLTVPDPR